MAPPILVQLSVDRVTSYDQVQCKVTLCIHPMACAPPARRPVSISTSTWSAPGMHLVSTARLVDLHPAHLAHPARPLLCATPHSEGRHAPAPSAASDSPCSLVPCLCVCVCHTRFGNDMRVERESFRIRAEPARPSPAQPSPGKIDLGRFGAAAAVVAAAAAAKQLAWSRFSLIRPEEFISLGASLQQLSAKMGDAPPHT